MNNRTQAKVAEELGMQEFAITNDKTKRPVALRTKTLADLLECKLIFWCFVVNILNDVQYHFTTTFIRQLVFCQFEGQI